MTYLLRISVSLCLLLVCPVAATTQGASPAKSDKRKFKHKAKIETIYDAAKDETAVFLMPMTVRVVSGATEAYLPADGATRPLPSEVLEIMAHFSHPGKTPTTPRNVTIGFRSLSQGRAKYAHADDRELSVKADGSRLSLGAMEVTGRRIDSGVQLKGVQYFRETLELAIKYEDFQRITSAKEVRMRLGDTEFSLSNNHKEALRDLVSRMVNES